MVSETLSLSQHTETWLWSFSLYYIQCLFSHSLSELTYSWSELVVLCSFSLTLSLLSSQSLIYLSDFFHNHPILFSLSLLDIIIVVLVSVVVAVPFNTKTLLLGSDLVVNLNINIYSSQLSSTSCWVGWFEEVAQEERKSRWVVNKRHSHQHPKTRRKSFSDLFSFDWTIPEGAHTCQSVVNLKKPDLGNYSRRTRTTAVLLRDENKI